MTYKIVILPVAQKTLKVITDRRVLKKIGDRIDRLEIEPEKQGKPLGDELLGFRCVRAVGQRYRIIYRIDGKRVLVAVAAVGLRREGHKKDIYRLARNFWRLGLFDLPEDKD